MFQTYYAQFMHIVLHFLQLIYETVVERVINCARGIEF